MKRPGFMMDDYEIAQSYKEAKSKKDQIRILAELNCTTTDKIKFVLNENGIPTQGKAVKPKVAPVQPERIAIPEQREPIVKKVGMLSEALAGAIDPIREEMCDKYCKYSELLKRPRTEMDKTIYEDLLNSICEKCPLR